MTFRFGFSLLELLITLAIIAILAAVSYPLYTHHLIKVRRLEGKTGLLQLANQLERYAVIHGNYQGATLDNLGISTIVAQGFYRLNLDTISLNAYEISATPLLSQQQDKACSRLTLDSAGGRSFEGNGSRAECW